MSHPRGAVHYDAYRYVRDGENVTVRFDGYVEQSVEGDTTLSDTTWSIVRIRTYDRALEVVADGRIVARVVVPSAGRSYVDRRVLDGSPNLEETIFYFNSRTLPDSTSPDTITVSGQDYDVDGVGYVYRDGGDGCTGYNTVMDFGTDLGVVGYVTEHFFFCREYVDRDVSTLAYAEVGGQVYGENPVAEEAHPGFEDASTVTVTPNPSRGVIALRLALPRPGAARVEVFDALGRRVHVVDLPAGLSDLRLDAADWRPGVYVARVTTASGQVAMARFVRAD